MSKKRNAPREELLPDQVREALCRHARDAYIEQIAEELVVLIGQLSGRPSEPWIRNLPVVDYLTTKLMREQGNQGDDLLAELQWRLLEVVDEWSKDYLSSPAPQLAQRLEQSFEALQKAATAREQGG